MMCVIYFAITEDLVIHLARCGHACCWPFLLTWRECTWHVIVLMVSPLYQLVWNCTFGLFLLNTLFCSFNILLCCGLCQEDPLPDTVYNNNNNNNNNNNLIVWNCSELCLYSLTITALPSLWRELSDQNNLLTTIHVLLFADVFVMW